MRVKINGLGVYNYMLPALTAWAVRQGYKMPEVTDETLICFYTDEFESDTTAGSHQRVGIKTGIKIRPGQSDELDTWAHEFAHMIQATNLGTQWGVSYRSQTEDKGYDDNIFEVEAREAGRMATKFEELGWLLWEKDYNTEGEYSNWPQPKRVTRKSGMCGFSREYYYSMRSYEIVPLWESDWYQYDRPAEIRYTALVKITLRIFVGYIDNNAVLNMQQYAA